MKLWKYLGLTHITYSVDYEDDRSFLDVHWYANGIKSCGYADRAFGEPSAGPNYFEASFLDLLVVTGISEEKLAEVKRQKMDSLDAAEFLSMSHPEPTT